MKPIEFLGHSLERLREFPKAKTTRATSKHALEAAAKRYRELISSRRDKEHS